jgi:hypothetical protein
MSGPKSEASDKTARDEFMVLLVLVESAPLPPVNRLWSREETLDIRQYLGQRPVWRRSPYTQSHVVEMSS